MLNKFPTIRGELYFGPIPDDKTLYELKNEGVTIIWNLGYELFDIAEIEIGCGFWVFEAKISDYNTPLHHQNFKNQLLTICSSLACGYKVFVHCMGGRGRTGMALALIAKIFNGVNSDEALALAKEYCDGPEVDKQIEYVRNFEC